MGARVNFIFDDSTDNLVGFYSHWGADSWRGDLAKALVHAKPRLGDYSYFTRMVISYLIQDELLEETGFGIYGLSRDEMTKLFDETVIVDLFNQVIIDDNKNEIPFYSEVNA